MGKIRHILSVDDLNKEEILSIVKDYRHSYQNQSLNTKRCGPFTVGTLFLEPSTRTRLSFETATYKLGGQVISAGDKTSSSLSKGESIRDTIRIISKNYVDILVIRADGVYLQDMVPVAACPIINAGDAENEHPTQALADLATIYRMVTCNLDKSLTVSILGDVEYGRAVRSFEKIIRKFDITLSCDNPDVIYLSRSQTERHGKEYSETEIAYIHNFLEQNPNAYIMHPMPRGTELPEKYDNHPRALYFYTPMFAVHTKKRLINFLLNERYKNVY